MKHIKKINVKKSTQSKDKEKVIEVKGDVKGRNAESHCPVA